MFELEWLTFLSCRCVGVAVAAFARAVLEGSAQPGVWFPEEVQRAREPLYQTKKPRLGC